MRKGSELKDGTSIGDRDGDGDGEGDDGSGGGSHGPVAWTRTLSRGREGCRPRGVGRAGSGGGGEARVSLMGVSSSSSPIAPPPDPRIREWSIASRELRADVGSADLAAMAGVLENSRNAQTRQGHSAGAPGSSRNSQLDSLYPHSDRIKIS